MTYTTPSKVRSLLGLDSTQAPDSVLNNFITYADQIVTRMISVLVVDEEMSGTIDGSNTEFYVSHYPIADTDYDKTVDTDEVTVYGWTDSSDPNTKTQLTVSQVKADIGLIILETAPTTDYKKITCTYSYYTRKIDWNLVELASTLYTAYRFIVSEVLLVPESWSLGSLKVKLGSRKLYPYHELHREFLNVIDMIRKGYAYSEAQRYFTHPSEDSTVTVDYE